MKSNVREKALVVCALVKLVDRVDVAHAREVAKGDLVRCNTHNRTVCIKELLDRLALSQPEDVGVDPQVGDGSIPWSRNRAKRGQT